MRVIAGISKGRRLCAPKTASIRPTTDKVREAVFDVLTHAYNGLNEAAFPFRLCLDLFAGSGAMGIEAMSRGAEALTFVDDSPAAIKLIRRNLEICGFEADLLKTDAIAAIRRLAGQKRSFDLIFVDPPYDSSLALDALRSIDGAGIVGKGGIVVIETSKRASMNEIALKNLVLSDERRYGDTAVYFYRLRSES